MPAVKNDNGGSAVKNLATTAILLAGVSMTPAEAAPSLKDCERIFQQAPGKIRSPKLCGRSTTP